MDRARQAGVKSDVGEMATDQPAVIMGSPHAAPINGAKATYKFKRFRISE